MRNLINSSKNNIILNKSDMYSFYFENPKQSIERELNNTKLKYFYFNSEINLKTQSLEILNGSLLKGEAEKVFYLDNKGL